MNQQVSQNKSCSTYYTESNIVDSAAPLIATSIGVNNLPLTDENNNFNKAFPEAKKVLDEMFHLDPLQKEEGISLPSLGDVVWVSPNPKFTRLIGYCILFDETNSFSEKAYEKCLNSIKNKADQLDIHFIGFGLFGCKKIEEWAERVPLLEQTLSSLERVVCIPNNEDLIKLLESL